MNDSQKTAAEFWQRAARRTALKLNAGWWLQRFAPLLIVGGAVTLRQTVTAARAGAGWRQIFAEGWPWMAGAVVVPAVVAWVWARKSFITSAQAMVQLEEKLRLNNALSTASSDRGAWPEPPPAVDDGFRYRWTWLTGPPFAFACCVALALLVPQARTTNAAEATTQPLSWPQMDDWLKKMEDEAVIEPEQLKDLKERLDELKQQPQDKWFSHESLEASDHLRDELASGIEKMGSDLQQAERSIDALSSKPEELSAATKDKLVADYSSAIQGLQGNALKLDPELASKLGQIDPKALKGLSKEQMEQLKEAMKKKSGACKNCNGSGKKPGFLGDGEGEDDAAAQLAKMAAGLGEGKEGQGPGNGGVTRGPGAAELFLGDEESRLGTKNHETVTNPDLSRATPADLLALQNDKHEVDRTAKGPQAAGAVGSKGEGGQQVWKERLSPEEKAVLKKFFK